MKNILKYLKKYRLFVVIVLVSATIKAFANLLIPNTMGSVIEAISLNDSSNLMNFFFTMLLLSLVSFLIHIVQNYYAAKITSSYQHDLRSALFSKVESLSLEELNDFETSSLITRTTSDINMVSQFFTMLFRMGVTMPIMGVVGVFLAYNTAKDLSWIILVTVLTMIAFIAILAKIVLPRSVKVQKLVDKLNLLTREALTGIRVIRAFNAEELQTNKYKAANKDYYNNSIIMNIAMSFMGPVVMLIGNLAICLVVYFGAGLVDIAALEVDSIVVFIQYLTQVLFAFMLVTMIFIMYPRVKVSADRISEVLSKDVSIKDPVNPKKMTTNGEIVFKNVSFRYPGSEEAVLENINLTINKGERVAFIGSTGSGKSTIINLIPRLYDIFSGELLINGVDIKEINLKDLRDRIGFVPQRGNLFKGTISDNIKFSYTDATNEEIDLALKVSQSYNFVNEKPEKLDFMISQNGKNVSGGQRQRLSIARALVKKHDFLIFDDSLSALDYKTASNLQTALNENFKDTTIIQVAQRVSSIMSCDKIVVLDEGKIDQVGTHKELLKTSKIYLEIACSQLSKEELSI